MNKNYLLTIIIALATSSIFAREHKFKVINLSNQILYITFERPENYQKVEKNIGTKIKLINAKGKITMYTPKHLGKKPMFNLYVSSNKKNWYKTLGFTRTLVTLYISDKKEYRFEKKVPIHGLFGIKKTEHSRGMRPIEFFKI